VLAKIDRSVTVTGLETGSERIRKEILNRNISNETIKQKIAICNRNGLKIATYNMVGFNSETMDEILLTIKMNAEINPTRSTCTIIIPYPGTELNEKCKKENLFIGGREPDVYPEFTEQPIIKNDNLSVSQIIFFKKYFNTLKKLYQIFPAKMLDRFIKSRIFPYGLLNKISIVVRPFLVFIYLKLVAKVYNRYK
jgi:radical SAM superfamily enzyme YgiQ (UPF0313 family)